MKQVAVSLEAVHTHTHTICLSKKIKKIYRRKDSNKDLQIIGFYCCLFCIYQFKNRKGGEGYRWKGKKQEMMDEE